jgi:predicted phage tail component-like protein
MYATNYGFTLGGKTAKELGIIMLRSSQRPVLPGTVDRTLAIPGRHGAWDFGADLAARRFDLECALIADDVASREAAISALAAHLVDSTGRPRELDLIFDNVPDRKYRVRYSGTLPIDRLANTGRFTLPLVAFDPFATGLQEQLVEEVVSESPHMIQLTTDGNVRTSPVIVLSNEGATTITNFKITNEYRLE